MAEKTTKRAERRLSDRALEMLMMDVIGCLDGARFRLSSPDIRNDRGVEEREWAETARDSRPRRLPT